MMGHGRWPAQSIEIGRVKLGVGQLIIFVSSTVFEEDPLDIRRVCVESPVCPAKLNPIRIEIAICRIEKTYGQ